MPEDTPPTPQPQPATLPERVQELQRILDHQALKASPHLWPEQCTEISQTLGLQHVALSILREQRDMLRHDNDGHAEYLSVLHQQLLTELPDSDTTAAVGRLLAAWGRTPDEPQYVPAAALAAAEAREAGLRAALGRVQTLADTWSREADAIFGALPSDPGAGIRQAGRASELEARADALTAALGGTQ